MRAWTVDADDIRVAEDFDDSLLHRTPEIESFLNPDRDDKFIVIGTKGFGKTLLLKAKRILYQRQGRMLCLPSGNLLDKPIGDKIFGRETIGWFAASPLPWSKTWLTAIAVATLKHLDALAGLKVGGRLAGLVADQELRSVIDHFVRLLDFTPSELQRCATDTDGHLVPRLRSITSSMAIFIDGIDEYFNKHVEGLKTSASVTGELSPNVWYFAQLGLVDVAYQLRRINHHLKVFAAIRKEAYVRLPRTTAMAQQYRGSAIDIVYSIESLREIFVNNVRLVKSDKMVRPERVRADPLEAFMGRSVVLDPYTREEEGAFEYLCRHTFLRPRDLMTIGEHLAALRPDERASEPRLKEAVHQAAAEIAYEYLAEIAPYIGDLDLERFLRRLPGPILTRDEVVRLFQEHRAGTDAAEEEHVFCTLYRVGLLGYVQPDRARGQWVQRFLRPGEATLVTMIRSRWLERRATSWTTCIRPPVSPDYGSPCTTARYRRARETATPSPFSRGETRFCVRRASSRTLSPARSGQPRSLEGSSRSDRRCGARRLYPLPMAPTVSMSGRRTESSPISGFDCTGSSSDALRGDEAWIGFPCGLVR